MRRLFLAAYMTAVPVAVHAGIDWVTIPGGTFTMGSNGHLEDERPAHKVTLATFEMAKTEVTVQQYKECVDAGQCSEPKKGGLCNWGRAGAENMPLICVTGDEAKTFSAWAGGRLPSEAEWEYAARSGGKLRQYPWGDGIPTCKIAAIKGCGVQPAPVCSTPEGNTDQGLCDMAGNVWEWAQDWYHPSYEDAPTDGSAQEERIPSFHQVMRGGSWMYDAAWARTATRNDLDPLIRGVDLGFRPVRSPQLTRTLELPGPHTDVVGLAYSPDGKKILSGDREGTIKLWDARSQELLSSWKGHAGGVHALAFTHAGDMVLSGSGDSIKKWDLKTGRMLLEIRHGVRIEALVVSPDDRTLAVIYYDEDLALWDLANGQRIAFRHTNTLRDAKTIVKGELAVTAAFSPDGRHLVVGQWDTVIRAYDLKEAGSGAAWRGHPRHPTAITFAPDGTQVLSGDRGGTVILWDLPSGKPLVRQEGGPSGVLALAFSPDGKSALSVDELLDFKMWDLATGRQILTWKGQQRNIESVVFSPDRTQIVSAGEDDAIKVWDAAKGPNPRGEVPWTGNAEERLGRTLFFDPRLSGDNSFACVMCHRPEKAFTDGGALSAGFTEALYFRNTPTLINAVRQKHLYWDARFPGEDMPSLVRDHMSEAHFMNADGRMILERLRQAPEYVAEFGKVYQSEPTYVNMLKALTAFVASLRSAEAPFDGFLQGDTAALSPQARRGYDLFRGEAGCIRCHNGALFSDGQVHDRKVPTNPEIFSSPMRHISFRRFFRILGVRAYQNLREDPGHSALSHNASDKGKFRTPSLREVARTPPYMHNGMLRTLDDAVRHEGPELSRQDREDIVAFLQSLSSPSLDLGEPALPQYQIRPRRPRPVTQEPLPPPADVKDPPALAALPPVPVPADNPLTPAKIELGKLLFFDERTSGNGHTSCLACHVPLLGWGDIHKLSRDYTSSRHFRHTQTIINSAYFSKLNWDGFAESLEDQAHDAITTALVGNGDTVMVEERLAQVPGYVERFKEVFGVDRPHFDDMLKALAAFMRAEAVSQDVPFERYLRGDKEALTAAEVRGLGLYQGKAACILCHNGALASDQKFHATGVPQSPIFDTDPFAQITLRFIHSTRGVPEEVYRRADSDPGLYLITKDDGDIAKFRTPSLRELKYTAPYMHNGVFDTLEEVVEFYDGGGGQSPNKSPLLAPLRLTADEKRDLIAFLRSLSSAQIVGVEHPPTGNLPYGIFP